MSYVCAVFYRKPKRLGVQTTLISYFYRTLYIYIILVFTSLKDEVYIIEGGIEW